MRRIKRLMALMLAFFMVLTSGYNEALASAVTDTAVVEETEVISDIYAPKEALAEEQDEDNVQAKAEQVLVNYLVVEEQTVVTPGRQTVMLGIGEEGTIIEAAELSYENQRTGEVFTAEADEIADNFVMFQMEYPDDSWNGTYQLIGITYTEKGITTETTFAEMGIEAEFGINESVEAQPDDVLLTEDEVAALAEDANMSIVSFDEEGNVTSEENIEEALESAGCEKLQKEQTLQKGASLGVSAYGMKSLVVVLDAGHGGTDGGTSHNGIVEKNVNLKIAQYCKAELEEYSGVTVYMTRNSDTYLSLADRAQVAVDKKADVFISLHNNANESTAVSGACVYYPNASYNSSVHTTGKSLAAIIESKLTDLGLASGGIKIRNSENGTLYPDGSKADYYGVIKRCKENGIPGLIVEHAFVTNASDVANYLSTDEQLKRLGVADAAAIAEYYGLSKGLGFSSIQSKNSTTMDLSWTQVVGVTGYCIYRSTSSGSGFKKVAEIKPASATTWKDSGLKPGSTYYYKIRTYTEGKSGRKYGKYSTVATGTTMESPEISSIKSKNSTQLVISWATVNNAASYEIYRATKADGNYKKIATVAGINRVNYTDKKLTAGKLYYYKVRSIGQVDNTTIYSDYSAIASGRTAKIPDGLSVKSADSNTLRISWKADENASGYVITRAASKTGKYTKLATIKDASVNSYDDATVKAGTAYYYKIQANNLNDGIKGQSGYSKAVSGKTVKKTSITKIVSNSATRQTITWKKVSGANGYVIYYSTAKKGTYKKLKTIKSANTTSCKVSGLKPGTRYYYKIRTRNKVNGKTGYGSYSTVRNAWSGEIAEIAVTGNSGAKIQVSWKPVNGADSYVVYRANSSKGSYKEIGTVKGTESSFIDKQLKMTKKYYYKVEVKMKGYKGTGTAGMSKAAGTYPVCSTTITSVAPNEKGILQVTWNKVKDIEGYQVYRSTEEKGTYQLVKTITGYQNHTYEDTTATAGITYYYKVRLVGSYQGKNIYGNDSAAASGSLLAVPKNVIVTSVAENQLDITWTKALGATGYILYRSNDLNGSYTEIARINSASVTLYSDTTVTTGVTYYYKIKSIDNNNHSSEFSSTASGCAVAKIAVNSVRWKEDNSAILLAWTPAETKISGYEVYKCAGTDVAHQTRVAVTKETSCMDSKVEKNETYYYRVRPYTEISQNGKNTVVYGAFSDTVSTNPNDYRIMGSTEVTKAQMVSMYQNSGKVYPVGIYKDKGAATIEEFVAIVYEEACIEGVKPEVIFAQICHETGYLQFGEQVKAAQCNFGGLGAVDGGTGGETFQDVRTGIRTQVQHMKAYASTNPLKQPCVDGRFFYVERGKAEFVQQLGKGNWATDKTYDVKLMVYINKIKGE